jgi:hypothetical protein
MLAVRVLSRPVSDFPYFIDPPSGQEVKETYVTQKYPLRKRFVSTASGMMHHSTGEGSTHCPPHHHLESHDPCMPRVETKAHAPSRGGNSPFESVTATSRSVSFIFFSDHQSLCLILFQLSLLTDLHQPSTLFQLKKTEAFPR